MVRGHTADLIVLDLGLSDMDGLDVVRQIRDDGETLPIIILSSRDNESAKVKALISAPMTTSRNLLVSMSSSRVSAPRSGIACSRRRKALVRCWRSASISCAELSLCGAMKSNFRRANLMFWRHGGARRQGPDPPFHVEEVWGADADVQYLRVYIRALRQKSRRTRSGRPIF